MFVTLKCHLWLRFNSFGLGTTFPALSALLASWIPLTERSKLGSLVFGGGQVSLSRNFSFLFFLNSSATRS